MVQNVPRASKDSVYDKIFFFMLFFSFPNITCLNKSLLTLQYFIFYGEKKKMQNKNINKYISLRIYVHLLFCINMYIKLVS